MPLPRALLLSGISPEASRADSPPAEGGRGREWARDILAVLLGLGNLPVTLLLDSEAAGDGDPRNSLGLCGGVIELTARALSFKFTTPEYKVA